MERFLFSSTGVACSNIAFIKYWGNLDNALRLPSNSSLSMNLSGLETRTRVTFDSSLQADTLVLNDSPAGEKPTQRVTVFLDNFRRLAGKPLAARVESWNNFPTGAGIASSASAFAALTVAAAEALSLKLPESALSKLARLGSGSACRSVPTGFVEWKAGTDVTSFAVSIAPPTYWDLVDCIAIVNSGHKSTGSTQGHALAGTSPLQAARVADTPRRLEGCRQALLHRDFEAFAEIVELDSTLMHSIMMTSTPPLYYWAPATLQVIQAVQGARCSGIPVCFTIDAGPNVHVLTLSGEADKVQNWLSEIPGVQRVLRATPGGPAHLIDN